MEGVADCVRFSICYTMATSGGTLVILRCGLRPLLDLLHFRSDRDAGPYGCGLRPLLDLLHYGTPASPGADSCGLRPLLDLLHSSY